jgi:agmatinase
MGKNRSQTTSPFPDIKAPTVLIGVPWDWESALQGTRYFPLCFREAGLVLGQSFLHDRKIQVQDMGDIRLAAKDTELSSSLIIKSAAELLGDGKKIVSIGGDHSITIPLVAALNEKVTVIIFDAHADALQNDSGPLSERVLTELSKNSNVNDIVVIGCRSGSKDFRNNKVMFEDLNHTYNGRISSKLGKILKQNNRIYVSFDFDVIDPAFISEVSYPQPLGLDPKTAIKILKHIINGKTMALDFVEFNPDIKSRVSNSMHNAIEIVLSAIEALGE